MLLERLHDSSENSLRDFGIHFDGVVSVGEDLWLNNGHESVVLADSSISSKSVCGLNDCSLRWSAISDLNNSSPLYESASLLVVLLASLTEAIKTSGGILVLGAWNDYKTLVDFNSWEDSLGDEELNEVDSIDSLLVEGLLEEDDSTDVLLDSSGEEEFSVSSSVFLVVLNVNLGESLANGAS